MKNTVAIALRVLGMLLGLTWVCGALANMAFPEAYVCSPGNNCPPPPSVLERAASNALFFMAGGLLLVPQQKCRQPMARKVYGLLLTGFSLFLAAFWVRQLYHLLLGDFATPSQITNSVVIFGCLFITLGNLWAFCWSLKQNAQSMPSNSIHAD